MAERKDKTELEDIFKISLQEARNRREDDKEEPEDDDEEEEGEEEEEDEDEEEESGKKRSKKKMEEETIAAASLKTHKSADAKIPAESRVEIMKSMIGAMAEMPKKDLVKWFTQTQSQFGPGKDYGVGDKSAANQATVDMKTGKGPKTKMPMPKIDVKEDVQEMFDGQELSEEFKEKASTIFEAAVNARVTVEVASLQEQFEQQIEEQVSSLTEQITTKLDSYLDYVVENWMKENEVAIESTLRNELMEEFIEGLKGLFAEHYINVPQTKVDVLEAMASKVEELEEKLDESITENNELKSVVYESQMKDVFESVATDLALTQREKFLALVEGIEFDGDLETYEKKLKIVKENYFKNENRSSNINEETFEGEINENVVNVDPTVNRYMQAIARTVKG